LLWSLPDLNIAAMQGTIMANDGATEQSRTEEFDAHVRDYSGFIRMFKWLAIISFVTAIFVMMIIS
jgi:hypothetical protein